MAGIAIAAVLINWLRPMTRAEAMGIAERRFREIPGSARWAGRYEVDAWWAGDLWFVNFTEHEGGGFLAQVPVTPEGEIPGVGIDSARFEQDVPHH